MTYGLIGNKLSHSFSKQIHERLADYTYELIALNEQEFQTFMEAKNFQAINVTIPYKKAVIPYLDIIDESAKAIGAVNTIVHRNHKLIGYNTDYAGFDYMLKKHAIQLHGKKVLIIGNGGAGCAVKAVAQKAQAKNIILVNKTNKNGAISYEECYENHTDMEIIINTSPVGMYPALTSCPIDLYKFPLCKVVIDVIYNPLHTALCQQAKKQNIQYVNGMEMLLAQAKYAVEIFLNKKIDDTIIDTLYQELLYSKLNLVFIGMPGAGKSTIGKDLSHILQKEFIDTDQIIEQKMHMTIAEIFSTYGEEYFRVLEKEVCLEISNMHNTIIATGGGVIKHESNIDVLSSNSIIIYLDRAVPLLKLHNAKRPLAQNEKMLAILFNERDPLYRQFADYTFQNNGSIQQTLQQIINNLPNMFNQFHKT